MLTLNWLTQGQDIAAAGRVADRLLEEVPELSAVGRNSHNMLIQGDNLESLKTLQPFYAKRVTCIYIDPPYNTHSAFEHYEDNRGCNSHALTLVPSWAGRSARMAAMDGGVIPSRRGGLRWRC